MSLTLEDFSDRELLFALEEHSDGEGTISSHELSDGLGLQPQNGLKHPHMNVAIRLSWLKRYGVVARNDETRRWFLTPVGSRLMHGSLKAGERRLMDDLDEDRLFAAMESLGQRMVGAHDEAATMVARHWRYTLAERKRNRTGRR